MKLENVYIFALVIYNSPVNMLSFLFDYINYYYFSERIKRKYRKETKKVNKCKYVQAEVGSEKPQSM